MRFTTLSASPLNTVLVAGPQQFAFGEVWTLSASHSRERYFFGSIGAFLTEQERERVASFREQFAAAGLELEQLPMYKASWIWLDQLAIENWVRENYPGTPWDDSLFPIARTHRPLRGAAILACGNRVDGYLAIESEHFPDIGLGDAFTPQLAQAGFVDLARAA